MLLDPYQRSFRRDRAVSTLFLLQCSTMHRVQSQTSTTATNDTDTTNDDDDKYDKIWPTMIIVFFGIVVVVIVLYLVHRIYKKRRADYPDKIASSSPVQSAEATATVSSDKKSTAADQLNASMPMSDQLKFRAGSMSSVERRHERIPSKPVVISITTPRGTKHVADAFGEYDGDAKDDPEKEKQGLSEITEDAEEEYDQKTQQATSSKVEPNNDKDNEGSDEEDHWDEYERNKSSKENNDTQGDEHTTVN